MRYVSLPLVLTLMLGLGTAAQAQSARPATAPGADAPLSETRQAAPLPEARNPAPASNEPEIINKTETVNANPAPAPS